MFYSFSCQILMVDLIKMQIIHKIFSEIDTNKVVNLWDSCPLKNQIFINWIVTLMMQVMMVKGMYL